MRAGRRVMPGSNCQCTRSRSLIAGAALAGAIVMFVLVVFSNWHGTWEFGISSFADSDSYVDTAAKLKDPHGSYENAGARPPVYPMFLSMFDLSGSEESLRRITFAQSAAYAASGLLLCFMAWYVSGSTWMSCWCALVLTLQGYALCRLNVILSEAATPTLLNLVLSAGLGTLSRSKRLAAWCWLAGGFFWDC
jgi:hypothetical protein